MFQNFCSNVIKLLDLGSYVNILFSFCLHFSYWKAAGVNKLDTLSNLNNDMIDITVLLSHLLAQLNMDKLASLVNKINNTFEGVGGVHKDPSPPT